MENSQTTLFESGINFELISRPTLDQNRIVAIFDDSGFERQKIELTGNDLKNVIEQLLPIINNENVLFMEKVLLYMNPSNPIYRRVTNTEPAFPLPLSTVSPFTGFIA